MIKVKADIQDLYYVELHEFKRTFELIYSGITHPNPKYTPSIGSSVSIITYFQLEYVLGGKGTLIVNGNKIPITKGDTLFINPGISREIINTPDDPLSKLFITVRGPFIELITKFYGLDKAYEVLPIDIEEELRTIINLLDSNDDYTENINNIIAVEILKAIQKISRYKTKSFTRTFDATSENVTAKNIMKFITENLTENLTIERLCKEFGMSKTQLIKIFKSSYHYTPMNFVQLMRVELADTYIKDTSIPLLEISSLVGFKDAKYLSKLMKKHRGVTPRERRLKSRKSKEISKHNNG